MLEDRSGDKEIEREEGKEWERKRKEGQQNSFRYIDERTKEKKKALREKKGYGKGEVAADGTVDLFKSHAHACRLQKLYGFRMGKVRRKHHHWNQIDSVLKRR